MRALTVSGVRRQVMGDSSKEADKLMRSQGVRALPSFHFVRATRRSITRPLPASRPPTSTLAARSGRAANKLTASAARRLRRSRTPSRPTCEQGGDAVAPDISRA